MLYDILLKLFHQIWIPHFDLKMGIQLGLLNPWDAQSKKWNKYKLISSYIPPYLILCYHKYVWSLHCYIQWKSHCLWNYMKLAVDISDNSGYIQWYHFHTLGCIWLHIQWMKDCLLAYKENKLNKCQTTLFV